MNSFLQHRDRKSIVGISVALLLASILLLSWGPTRSRLIALVKPDAGLRMNIVARQGGSQMATTNTQFATRLQAAVTDSSGNPLSGVTVMFGAPASGPSAAFGSVANTSVLSDSAGIALAPPLTANGQDGSYTVTASVPSVEMPAYFSLINTPGSPQNTSNGASEAEIKRAPRFGLLVMEGLCVLAAFYFLCIRFSRADQADRMFSALATIGVSVSIFTVLATFARDDYFAPLETLMTNPGSLAVYGQRLLLVWFADAIKLLVPSLSYRRCYLATQLVAIFAATYMIGQWAASVVGKQWKIVGQLLFAAMLIPTITYGTFYDIPMVCIYATCLYFLHKQRYYAFVATLGVGTLNHENTLLLVPVAALVLWGITPRKISFGVPFAAFAVWGATRLTIQRLIPEASHFDPRLWSNLVSLSHPSAELIKSFMSLVFWWSCAAIGFRSAGRFVRRAAILLPALIAVTVLAGRFVEARQFDAFIPVAIALILSHLNRMTGASGVKGSDTGIGLAAETLRGLKVDSIDARRTVPQYERGF
jgi:hypothetical protein